MLHFISFWWKDTYEMLQNGAVAQKKRDNFIKMTTLWSYTDADKCRFEEKIDLIIYLNSIKTLLPIDLSNSTSKCV